MTREEALLNAYLKGVKTDQSKAVSSGTQAVSSAASEGVKMMNQAANVHIPSMYDYSKDMYKLIQKRQEEQIKAEKAAQRAAASAAKKQQQEQKKQQQKQQQNLRKMQSETAQRKARQAYEDFVANTSQGSASQQQPVVEKPKTPEEIQQEALANYDRAVERMGFVSSEIPRLDEKWGQLLDERDKLSQGLDWAEVDRAGMSSPEYRQYQELTSHIEDIEESKKELEAELEKISAELRPIVKELPDDERATAYAQNWYILSDEEKKDAKEYVDKYTSHLTFPGFITEFGNEEKKKMYMERRETIEALQSKMDSGEAIGYGLLSAVPGFDELAQKSPEYYKQYQAAMAQNPKSAIAGKITGVLGGYALGSNAVKAIPGLSAAAAKAGQALGSTKIAQAVQEAPIIGRAFTGDALTGIISDQIADTVLDTVPTTVQSVRENKPASAVAMDVVGNFGTNALMNIGAEGVLGTVGDALKNRQNQRIPVVETPESIEYNTPIPQLRPEVQADAEMGRPVQPSAETGAAVIPDDRSASRAVSLSPDEQIGAEWGSDAPWPTDADRPPEQVIPNYGDPFEMTNAEKAAEVTGKGLQSVYTREIAALYDDADNGVDITERAAQIAGRMVKESDFKVQGDTSYNNARKEFVKSPMRISDSELADLLYSSGEKSLSSFNKKYGTRITQTDQAAPYIDTVDFSAYGYSADPVTNFLDMLDDVKSFSDSVVDTRAYQESLQDMQDMIVSGYKMSRETNYIYPEESLNTISEIPALRDNISTQANAFEEELQLVENRIQQQNEFDRVSALNNNLAQAALGNNASEYQVTATKLLYDRIGSMDGLTQGAEELGKEFAEEYYFLTSPHKITNDQRNFLLRISGINSIDDFNAKYGTNLSVDDAGDFFSTAPFASDYVAPEYIFLENLKHLPSKKPIGNNVNEVAQKYAQDIIQGYVAGRSEIPYLRDNSPSVEDSPIPYFREDLPESIGAMRTQFDRPLVLSQQNTLRSIDEQNLSPADIEIQGGPVSYMHERVSFAEQRKNAENILSTESIDEVLDRLDSKDSWNSEDTAVALESVRRIDDALQQMDKTTDEYRSLFYANQQAKQRVQDSLSETGRTLGVTRMVKPSEAVVMDAQNRVQKAVEGLEKRVPKPFGNDVFKAKQAVKRAEDEAGKAVDDILSTVNMTARELGIDFRRLARQTGSEKQAALQKIQQAIQKARGLTDEQAAQLAEQIQQAYKQELEKAVDRNLRQMLPELFGKKANKAVPQAYDKFISLLNMGRYDDDAVKQLVASKWGIAPLSPEQTDQITALVEQANKYPAKSRQRADLQAQAASIASSNINSSLQEKWDAWRYTAMLGNVRTNERNIIGNVSQAMLARAKEVVQAGAEAGVDWIARNVFRTNGIQRTTAIISPLNTSDRALMAGAFKDADNAAYTDLIGGSEMFDISREMLKQGRVFNNNVLEGLRTGTSRALEGADYEGAWGALNAFANAEGNSIQRAAASQLERVAKRGEEGWYGISGLRNNYAWSLSEYLKANGADARIFQAKDWGSQELLDKARAWATRQALVNTYHEEEVISKGISTFTKILKENGGPVGKTVSTVLNGLFPFTKTPINILRSTYRYSPFGALSAIAKSFDAAFIGNRTAADAIDSWAKSAVGSAMVFIGYLMHKNGMLTGSMTEDEKKASEVTGQQEYSINFTGPDGKKYSYTIDWLSALSLPMLMGAEVDKRMTQMGKSEGAVDAFVDFLVSLGNAGTAMGEPLVKMTFLQSLDNAIQTASNVRLSDNDSSVLSLASVPASALTSYVTQGIPTVFGQVARGIDPLRRSTYTGQSGIGNVVAKEVQKAKNRIPFLSTTSEPYIDPLGQEQENPGGNILGRLAYQMLSPGYISEVKDINLPVYPERPEYTVRYTDDEGNPVSHRWTPEEYTEISRTQGQKSKDWIESLYDYPLTSALDQDQLVKQYEKGYSMAQDAAKRSLVPEIQQKYEREISSGKPDLENRLKWIYDNFGEDMVIEALTAQKLIDEVGTTKSGNKVVKTKKENSIELLMQYGYTREHAEYLYSLLTESDSLF